jgi:hypothetical protein
MLSRGTSNMMSGDRMQEQTTHAQESGALPTNRRSPAPLKLRRNNHTTSWGTARCQPLKPRATVIHMNRAAIGRQREERNDEARIEPCSSRRRTEWPQRKNAIELDVRCGNDFDLRLLSRS